MASQPQPAPTGPVPPPPPGLCTNCRRPDGTFFITTVLDCQAQGGTPVGDPFPCDEEETRTQQSMAVLRWCIGVLETQHNQLAMRAQQLKQRELA